MSGPMIELEKSARAICPHFGCLRRKLGIGACVHPDLSNAPCAATHNQLALSPLWPAAFAAIETLHEFGPDVAAVGREAFNWRGEGFNVDANRMFGHARVFHAMLDAILNATGETKSRAEIVKEFTARCADDAAAEAAAEVADEIAGIVPVGQRHSRALTRIGSQRRNMTLEHWKQRPKKSV